MPTYRYILCDLLTNTELAELPLANVTFDLRLNGAGSLSADLPLTDPKVRAFDPIGDTLPGRTAIYVDRDGVLLWGGIVWTRRTDQSNKLQLGCQEFESYFARRLITADAVFTQADQLAIARSLINTAQGKTGGNIGVLVGTETSGVLRDRVYDGYALKPVLEALQQLSAVQDGFDYAIEVFWDTTTGRPGKLLRLSYPQRGVVANLSGLLWEYPGNVQGYVWPEDATAQATTMYATGAGTPPGQLQSVAGGTIPGYPLLESKQSYTDVKIQATLDGHAAADLAAMQAPVVVPTITVRADLDPFIGSYTVGDEARLRITDDRFPGTNSAAGLDVTKRITAIRVTPPGSRPESVTLTLGDVVP